MPEDVVEHVRLRREIQFVPGAHVVGHQESLAGEGVVPGHGVRVADLGPHRLPPGPGRDAAVEVFQRRDAVGWQVEDLRPFEVVAAGVFLDLGELPFVQGAPDPVVLFAELHGRPSV